MKTLRFVAATTLAAGLVLALSGNGSAAREAADTPAPAVEDYAYPNADQVLAEHGLKVFRGDGRIVLDSSRTYAEGSARRARSRSRRRSPKRRTASTTASGPGAPADS
ncbi:hypothetical protein [Phytohabitans houttuyneae]|uniref:Uncharacterized protein n=1 Tax=Phytohabitans houttuyneae TaxID=1076126 RepID=A0A6V8JYU3_9ACTN|nr:hypothetical protein [Phytohabitans houttuyneae]GFJ76444.1 hypothetical protein Phou_006240 [Phytohabitans houttuyneae]